MPGVPWLLTIRTGPKVAREAFDDLEAALTAVEAHARAAAAERRTTIKAGVRTYAPADQVQARIELRGPRRIAPPVRAGVDVRGNGSAEAYLGKVQRRPIEPEPGEGVYEALRRAVTAAARA